MKRNALILSVVANIALVAALIFRQGQTPSADPDVGGVEVVTNTVTKRVAGPVEIVNSTNVVRLDWAGLESTDYVQYIRNLREVGCPEETIRDIIIADINKLYATRWRESQPVPEPWRYWRLRPKGEGKDTVTAQRRLELETERAALIQTLLGVEYKSEMSKYDWKASARREDGLAFLSADKRLWIENWEKRGKLEMKQLSEQIKRSGAPKESRAALLRELETRQQSELLGALLPAEIKEYHIRRSSLSDQLRKYLDPVEPTETEFRQMFALLGSRPEAMLSSFRLKGADSPLDDSFLQPRLQEILGLDRYAAFQEATRPSGKGGAGDGEMDRNEEQAQMVLRQIADEEIARIAADPRLSAEAREAQIKEIQKERKRMSAEFKKGLRREKR